jgi:YD repeat-containing protein
MSTRTWAGNQQAITSFGYDALDRLVRLGYPDGTSLRYVYQGRGAVVAIPGLLTSATYDAAGNPLERIFANGLELALGRDRAGRIDSVKSSVGPTRLLEVAYRLRASGAPFEATDGLGTTRFTLDDQERLLVEESPAGRRSQGYDAEGRLTSRWADPPDGRLPGMTPAFGQGAGPHALTSDQAGSYAYDGMGHRVTGRGLALDLDAAGQALAADGPGFRAEYVTAFDGERRERRVQWDDGRKLEVVSFGPVAELVDGVLWKHVLLGTERIASLTGALPPPATVGASPPLRWVSRWANSIS